MLSLAPSRGWTRSQQQQPTTIQWLLYGVSLVVLLVVVTSVNLWRTSAWTLSSINARTSNRVATNTSILTPTRLGAVNDTVALSSLEDDPPVSSPPRIVWLLSFPNSGTTFTLKYIQGVTQTTTATNYGSSEQVGYDTSLSVDPHVPEGPYLRYPTRPMPRHSILTKTHCEPHKVNLTLDDFVTACRTGKRSVRTVAAAAASRNVTTVTTRYPVASAAVHLIRNPVDNLVARMHYEQKRSHPNGTVPATHASPEPTTRDEWRQWCDALRHTTLNHYTKRLEMTNPQSLWNQYDMAHIPCALEFYRYFQWHALAHALTTTQLDDARVLYYEDYTTRYTDTVQELLSFLHFDVRATTATAAAPVVGTDSTVTNAMPTPDFVPGKTYPRLLTLSHIHAVERLGRAMAPDAWPLLAHYFDQLRLEATTVSDERHDG